MQSSANNVQDYLASLEPGRREIIETVRSVILKNLDSQYGEGMEYGMLAWSVPLSVYPPGYHCKAQQPLPFASLASQKNYISLYLMGFYIGCSDTEETDEVTWFREAWAASGKKKLDMGKSCIRFKKLDDIALDVIGEAIRRMPAQRYIERYEEVRPR